MKRPFLKAAVIVSVAAALLLMIIQPRLQAYDIFYIGFVMVCVYGIPLWGAGYDRQNRAVLNTTTRQRYLGRSDWAGLEQV